MRKLKFRIWNTIHKRLTSDCGIPMKGNEIITEFEHDKVMQFTGLKDKKGKEIYEGDIIVFEIGNDSYIGEIKFEAGAFIVGCHDLEDSYESLIEFDIEEDSMWQVRILGNIYENKELLDVKEVIKE